MEVFHSEINDGIKHHFVMKDGMKSVIVWFSYYMPLDNNASKNALLSNIILKGSRNFPSSKRIAKFLYQNYGASIGSNISLKGEAYTFSIYVNFLNSNVDIIESSSMDKVLNLMKDVIFDPLIDDGRFNEDYFEIERKNLLGIINNKINNKDNYAFGKCIESMFRNEPYGIDKLGKREWVEKLDNSETTQRYLQIIDKMPLDIYILGDLDHNRSLEIIENNFKLEARNQINIENSIIKKDKAEDLEESMNIEQGKLYMGFRTDINFNDRYFPSLVVMNKLFGGGPESRLFMNIRERNSMCYSIFSSIEKYKGLVMVSCGIDSNNREIVKEKIIDTLEDIRRGNIADYEVQNAKISSIHDYRSIVENNYTLISYMQGLDIYKSSFDIDTLTKKIEEVTKEEIINAGNRIYLDTIYYLGNR